MNWETAKRATAAAWIGLFRLLGAGIVVLYAIASLADQEAQVSIGLPLVGIALLLISYVDRLEHLKLSATGLEARLARAAQEAEALTKEARRVLLELAKHTAVSMELAGRFGGAVSDRKAEALNRITASLGEAGFSAEEIREVTDAVYPIHCFDYANAVWEAVSRNVAREHIDTVNAFWQAPGRRQGFGSEPSPDELEDLIRRVGQLTPWAATLIEDYRYFKREHRHREPERWRLSHRWRDGPM